MYDVWNADLENMKTGNDVNMGFPIAEIEADGVFNIAKEKNTGGCVTVGSCASQLLYEIQGPYARPSQSTKSEVTDEAADCTTIATSSLIYPASKWNRSDPSMSA